MKMNSILRWSLGVLSAMTVTAAASPTAASPANEKQYIGKIDDVNSAEHTVTVHGLVRHRTFDLGNNCAILRWDKTAAGIKDLRPGQKVTIGYQNINGVLAADRIEQNTKRYSGVVKSINPSQGQLVLRHWPRDQKFILAEDCKVMLHDQENGALDSIKPGDHVTVVYETPSGSDVVCQIAQTSLSFAGSIVAIDLPHRTISIEGTFGAKRFSLANDCSIVMHGRTDAPLMDLRPGQHLTVNYDQVNGVNVANRIAPAEGAHEAATAQANP